MEGHVFAVLDKFGIQGREREEFLGAAASLKGDIVQAQQRTIVLESRGGRSTSATRRQNRELEPENGPLSYIPIELANERRLRGS